PAAAPATPGAHIPSPKAGLWKSVTTSPGVKFLPGEACMDGGPFNPAGEEGCGAFAVTRGPGGAVVFDGVCVNNGVSAKSHVVMKGDYARAYVTDTTTTVSNPGIPDVTTTSHTSWTWAGKCPRG
ncbi:MAG TPA: DUF3617 family protein, partial [Caulobacteraceae bacterium]|nr:DUF3617 family protein [Caulobacteraceae bacterium]